MNWKLDQLYNRFVQDAHVFWGSINLNGKGSSFTLETFKDFFFNFQLVRTNPKYGVGELMLALSKPEMALKFIEQVIRFMV